MFAPKTPLYAFYVSTRRGDEVFFIIFVENDLVMSLKIGKIAIIVLATLGLLSCGKESGAGGAQSSKFNKFEIQAPSELTMPVEGGTAEMVLTSDADWTIMASEPWIAVTPKEGKGSQAAQTITITCEPNKTYDKRTASITLKAGSVTKVINVEQAGVDFLEAEVKEYDVPAEGGSVNVAVRTNVQFIATPEVSWIRYEKTKALLDKTVVLSVDANIGNIDREGKVKLLQNGGGLSVMITIRQEKPMPKIPEGAVDLGLSVYWGECNVGASKPEEIGNLYAWGETLPKAEYTWQNYKYYDENGKITKYNSYEDIVGFQAVVLDNLTVLLPEDDAATVNLGGKWRMPTVEEWGELREKCTWEPFEKGGLEICKVTGPEGECIYLPQLPDYKDNPRAGGYWSSSEGLYNESIGYSVTVYHCYTAWLWYDDLRPRGKCVRGVIDK